MSITIRAVDQLAEAVGYAAERTAPGSQYLTLTNLNPLERQPFEGQQYQIDRAFMHLLAVARWERKLTPDEIRGAVAWTPSTYRDRDGTLRYSDASADSSVDAAVARVWNIPTVAEDEG